MNEAYRKHGLKIPKRFITKWFHKSDDILIGEKFKAVLRFDHSILCSDCSILSSEMQDWIKRECQSSCHVVSDARVVLTEEGLGFEIIQTFIVFDSDDDAAMFKVSWL